MQPTATPDFLDLWLYSEEQRTALTGRPLRSHYPRLRRLAVHGSVRSLPDRFFQNLPASLEHIYLCMSVEAITSELLQGLPASVKSLTLVDSAHLQARARRYAPLAAAWFQQGIKYYHHRSCNRRGPFYTSTSWNEWLAAGDNPGAWRG